MSDLGQSSESFTKLNFKILRFPNGALLFDWSLSQLSCLIQLAYLKSLSRYKLKEASDWRPLNQTFESFKLKPISQNRTLVDIAEITLAIGNSLLPPFQIETFNNLFESVKFNLTIWKATAPDE